MTTGTHPARAARAPAGVFPTTHWSVVLAAGHGPPRDAEAALARLCEAYWYPLYAHVRRLGRDAEQARDLTQGFFSVLLERRGFERADSGRGRLRSFLCRSLENFLHHEHEHRQALKRGGGGQIISWDAARAEDRFAAEPQDQSAPDRAFERAWAQTLIEQVFIRLRLEFAVNGREEFFDRLRPHLWLDDDATPYAELAREFGLTTVNIKVTVHRLRRRFGAVLRLEIRDTLADPGEVEEELNHLIRVLGE